MELVRPKNFKIIKKEVEENKVLRYVFGSNLSKIKDLMDTFPFITKIVDLTYSNIKTRQKFYGDWRKILSDRFGLNSRIVKIFY